MSLRISLDRPSDPSTWLWVGLIGVASIALSRAFACATPFAALATIAAFTLTGRQALALVLFVWLANQGIGFGLLHYPWTPLTFAWGLAIGIAALAALAASREVARRTGLSPWMSMPLGLVAAFGCYELVLYATAWTLASGSSAFSTSILLKLFAINVAALGLLVGADRVASMTERRAVHPS